MPVVNIQQHDVLELIGRLGLDQKEAYAFLILIGIGASPVSLWAKHAGIKRPSMYVILERLVRLELVTTFDHRGIQHVQPVPVAQLPSLLEREKQRLTDSQTLLTVRLPELLAIESTKGITPSVKFYEGKRRVEMMYDEVLKETWFQAFFHPARVKAIMPDYFYKIPETLKSRNGRAQELLVRCREAEEYKRRFRSPRHRITILPKGITFSSDTIVTKEKIYLVGFTGDDAVGTEIWNRELAQTQSTLFILFWAKYAHN